MRTEAVGPSTLRILGGSDDNGGGDGPVVVLLHGFGAPGDDLVPLARAFGLPAAVRFVFPAAPLTLPAFFGDSRAWWMIDMERLERDMADGGHSDRRDERPAELPAARKLITDVLAHVQDTLTPSHLVLGGFSQGAMLAMDVLLHSERSLAGCVLLSGTLINASEWRAKLAAHASTPVFQSHGEGDPLLAFDAADELRRMLVDAGFEVDWHAFDGGHEIPPSVIAGVRGFLQRALAL